MEKIIKKWGDSLVIIFNQDEKRINDIEENDIVNISLVNLKKKVKK
jgi:hypothetical protein